MNILVVGNVIKDVYLNLDTRSENLEKDSSGVSWLDLSFDSKEHHFFGRTSSFGGAAITMEVLTKLGINTSISGSDFHYDDTGAVPMSPITHYRYILTSDSGTTYFTPSTPEKTPFATPTEDIDYIYVDRSAHLTMSAIDRINAYLDYSRTTKLILYLKDEYDTSLSSLARHADLIFLEKNRGSAENRYALQSVISSQSAGNSYAPTSPEKDSKLTPYMPPAQISIIANFPREKIIEISDTSLRYLKVKETISMGRVNLFTHLSAFSVISATVLGGFILGKTVEYSLKIARINIENSTLDSTLTLAELENLASSARENSLELIAATLMAPGKGILAADESGGSIAKKFATLGISDTYESRHNYRDIFFTTPEIEKYLSGVILFDETARDYASTGQTYTDFLISHRIIPGIKVDQGLAEYPNSKETYTLGLDSLKSRLAEYYQMGLRFAKWRAAFHIAPLSNGKFLSPTPDTIADNCRILAEYARECQAAGIVPIVEPEVVYDDNYTLEQNAIITSRILDTLFETLDRYDINLRACILKCNMVLAGKKYREGSTPDEVGRATAKVLKEHAPANLAGIVFLSGGQTPEQATANLAAILENGPFPWPLTFSFARALQDPALYTWRSDNANSPAARDAFLARLKANTEILS